MKPLFAPLCALAILAAPARADIAAAVADSRARVDGFAAATAALDHAAQEDCTDLRAPYHAAFEAWVAMEHLNFGPVEESGHALAIYFWPDKRGKTPKTVAATLNAPLPEDFGASSAAGRGLFALDTLLFDPAYAGFEETGAECALARAVAADLGDMAGDIAALWPEYATGMLAPGAGRFLDEAEVARAFLTAIMAALDHDAGQRIARPLGTFERPRPERAEARRSARTLPNILASLRAIDGLVAAFDPEASVTRATLKDAMTKTEELMALAGDDTLPDLTEPSTWLKFDILSQRITAAREAALAEIGARYGVSAGFNSADGD